LIDLLIVVVVCRRQSWSVDSKHDWIRPAISERHASHQYRRTKCCSLGRRIRRTYTIYINDCHIHESVRNRNTVIFYILLWTRSHTVARIPDRTASQHLRGSRDIIGHVIIW